MKIQTFSVVVGGKKCNASCPYCVSKMTGNMEETREDVSDINIRNFKKACRFAELNGVSTALLTGKGEPTLYPDHISFYLNALYPYDFPFIELQTNGILIPKLTSELYLKDWYDRGLTTISISCVHYEKGYNKRIFSNDYPDLKDVVEKLHSIGFSVRLSCVMIKGYIDSVDKVKEFIYECKEWGVEQFTIRPVSNSVDVKNDIYKWVEDNKIGNKTLCRIADFLVMDKKSTLLLELAHGGKVYDYDGQNISLSTCLTRSKDIEDIRQLIFLPDGHLYFDWEKKGAIFL